MKERERYTREEEWMIGNRTKQRKGVREWEGKHKEQRGEGPETRARGEGEE